MECQVTQPLVPSALVLDCLALGLFPSVTSISSSEPIINLTETPSKAQEPRLAEVRIVCGELCLPSVVEVRCIQVVFLLCSEL